MTVTYKTVSLTKALADKYPEMFEDEYSDDEYRSGIWRFVDGVPVELLAVDGGEPEDNSFHRDGSWIAGALQDAYHLGLANAPLTG